MKFRRALKTIGLLVVMFVLLFSNFLPLVTSNQVSAASSTSKSAPTTEAACKANSQYRWQSEGVMFGYQCVNRFDNPQSQADCNSKPGAEAEGYKYQAPGAGGGVGTCRLPDSQTACNANPQTRWISYDSQCVNRFDNPQSQADCETKPGSDGYIYSSAAGVGSCQAASQAAQTYCKGKTGTDLDACAVGYDTQSCTGLSGSDLSTCQAAKTAAASGTAPKDAASSLSCDTTFDDPLTWILCPVVNLLTSAVSLIDGWITSELTVQSNTIFCGDQNCQAYHEAWASFRDIALGLMVLAGLIMLIAQTMGAEILSAYTIRKVLPRVLIAAIGITLSWPLMQFAVALSNNLGFGVRHLIYAPFDKINGGISLSFGGGFPGGILTFLTGSTGLLAVVGASIAGLGIILSLAGTAALAVIIAILVLILRQVAIILLILVAPIAIVAYILPNTERMYRLWWDSFAKALMMFPLIAAFIAAGRVFSAVTLASSSNVFSDVIGFAAYFAPYFLIPATFKLAGGAVRQLGGFVNDRSRGGFDRLRQGRVNKMQTLGQRAKAGGLYEGKRWAPGSMTAARIANKRIAGVTTGYRGRYGFGVRGKEALADLKDIAANEAGKDPHMQTIAGNNLANRALAMGMGNTRKGRQAVYEHLMSGGDDGSWGEGKTQAQKEAEANEAADHAVKAAGAATRFTAANGVAAFRNMARDGTAIRDEKDMAMLAASVGEGNFGKTYQYSAEGASISRQVGRSGLAASTESAAALALATSDDLAGRTGEDRLYKGTKSLPQLRYEAWESGAGGESTFAQFNNSKGRDIRGRYGFASKVLRDRDAVDSEGKRVYSDDQVRRAAAFMVEGQQARQMGEGRANNREEARKAMEAVDETTKVSGVKALSDYMSTPTGRRDEKGMLRQGLRTEQIRNAAGNLETRTYYEPETQGDRVNEIASQRSRAMSEAEKGAINGSGGPPGAGSDEE
jgi:hypothetical protein